MVILKPDKLSEIKQAKKLIYKSNSQDSLVSPYTLLFPKGQTELDLS